MNSIKIWLLNVGLRQMGPSAIRAAIAALVGLLVAHSGMLEKLGIVYIAASEDIVIHLTTLKAWLGVTGIGLITALLTAAQHHTVAAVKGEPQSGDLRKEPETTVVGGKRAEDPPAA